MIQKRTKVDRQEVISLFGAGADKNAIAKRFNCTSRYVNMILNDIHDKGSDCTVNADNDKNDIDITQYSCIKEEMISISRVNKIILDAKAVITKRDEQIDELKFDLQATNKLIAELLVYKRANAANSAAFERIIDDVRSFISDISEYDFVKTSQVISFIKHRILDTINMRARNPDAQDI